MNTRVSDICETGPFSLPMPLWNAFMAGRMRALRDRNIEYARDYSDVPTAKIQFVQHARRLQKEFLAYLRAAREDV